MQFRQRTTAVTGSHVGDRVANGEVTITGNGKLCVNMSDDIRHTIECRGDGGHTDSTITAYQAYPQEIAEPALRARTFVAPFKRERMM